MVDGFCERAVAAGLPLKRVNISTRTLHPEIESIGHIWQSGAAVSVEPHRYNDHQLDRWQTSPLRPIVESMTTEMVRNDLTDPEVRARWPVYEEFFREGGTDHMVQLVGFGLDGELNGREGIMTTWLTDREGGFSDDPIAMLQRLISRLALAIKSRLDRDIAGNLLDIYVGHGAGREILEGSFRRGDHRLISAAIMVADIRGFTRLSDRLERSELTGLLNRCFDAMVTPIIEHGGDVLKYMGDGLLAVFDDPKTDDRADCTAALAAAREAVAALAAIKEPGGGGRPMSLDVALHLGEVFFGNVGARDRLDFTVLGPAVNEASRMEALCSALDQRIVVSQSFADEVGCEDAGLVSIGRHQLRGVEGTRELFALGVTQ